MCIFAPVGKTEARKYWRKLRHLEDADSETTEIQTGILFSLVAQAELHLTQKMLEVDGLLKTNKQPNGALENWRLSGIEIVSIFIVSLSSWCL